MFERFTPEARRSLELASALATSRGDGAVGPDHLLAGLADPASGLAAELLAEAGVDAQEVEAAMGPAPGGQGPMTPPFTGEAKKALELSLREALNLAHDHIGSGHLLLGVLRLGEPAGSAGGGGAVAVLHAHGVELAATRDQVRGRSQGARLGGRRRPRRTGRIEEAPTAHEQARAAARAAAAGAPSDEEVALRLAQEEGSRLQRALASLGVTPDELQEALAEVAADPVDDGPVELALGEATTLLVAGGPRAADLRSLVGAADHVAAAEGADGTLRADAPALGDAVWATLEGWLTA
jgi:ATP-dependent Clp protease ATP-binding subunit ClpC